MCRSTLTSQRKINQIHGVEEEPCLSASLWGRQRESTCTTNPSTVWEKPCAPSDEGPHRTNPCIAVPRPPTPPPQPPQPFSAGPTPTPRSLEKISPPVLQSFSMAVMA